MLPDQVLKIHAFIQQHHRADKRQHQRSTRDAGPALQDTPKASVQEKWHPGRARNMLQQQYTRSSRLHLLGRRRRQQNAVYMHRSIRSPAWLNPCEVGHSLLHRRSLHLEMVGLEDSCWRLKGLLLTDAFMHLSFRHWAKYEASKAPCSAICGS